MRHVGFREMLLLAKSGVPWQIAMSWSSSRRSAALRILEQAEQDRW